MPTDYSKSKIYKIVCNETGDTYYGSTTQSLSKRLAQHRKDAKYRNISSKKIIDRGTYDIILCETCPCENKEQLYAIERKWIEENKCVNKIIPCRIKEEREQYLKEYYQENKEKAREAHKEYKEAHKEQILINQKEYREANKEKMKEYREANKDKIREYKKLYREANKQKINEYHREWKRKKNKETI